MQQENKLQIIENGLVAFFDILGFKAILSANGVEESLKIINNCMLKALDETRKSPFGLKFKIETFVISDSILVALPGLTDGTCGLLFLLYCHHLFSGLLFNGLPTRGAIAFGKFAVLNRSDQIVFVGQPIVDSHELAESLDIAACAVTLSSESKVLNDLTRELFQVHETPRKKLPPCELYLLKYGTEFSRAEMVKYFEQHNKSLGEGPAKKLSNTIEFLKVSGELKSV